MRSPESPRFSAVRTCVGQCIAPKQVPPSYDAITGEWLSEVLCRGFPGAKVVAHRFDERDDGSSNRRRIFLEYNDVGARVACLDRVLQGCETLNNRLVLGLSRAPRSRLISTTWCGAV